MNYLYNGIELPALPEWDKAVYPYAYIWTLPSLFPSVPPDYYKLTVLKSPIRYGTVDGKLSMYIEAQTSAMYNCPKTDGEFKAWEYYGETVGSKTVTVEPIWTNHDVISDIDGSVFFAASDPVPVTPHDPTVLLMGWLAGERMAAMRGKQTDEPSVTILTKPFDGEITTGEDGTGSANLDGCMPAGTEFIVNVNGTSLSGIVDESGQYYSDNINMDDGSVDYTKYPVGVALMLGMIMVIGEINTTYTVSVSVTKYPETVWCYNGVWLYAFDWDKEQYPYATLMAYDTGIGPSYRMHLAKYTLDRDRELYVHNEGDGTWFLHSVEGWGSANTSTGGNKSVSENTAIWTNYDMLYEDGTTYLAASEPVAVYE